MYIFILNNVFTKGFIASQPQEDEQPKESYTIEIPAKKVGWLNYYITGPLKESSYRIAKKSKDIATSFYGTVKQIRGVKEDTNNGEGEITIQDNVGTTVDKEEQNDKPKVSFIKNATELFSNIAGKSKEKLGNIAGKSKEILGNIAKKSKDIATSFYGTAKQIRGVKEDTNNGEGEIKPGQDKIETVDIENLTKEYRKSNLNNLGKETDKNIVETSGEDLPPIEDEEIAEISEGTKSSGGFILGAIGVASAGLAYYLYRNKEEKTDEVSENKEEETDQNK